MGHLGALRLLLLLAILEAMSADARSLLPDLVAPQAHRSFRLVNDAVMGGLSRSRIAIDAGNLLFEGEVSLANGGGFASFRAPLSSPADAGALLLTVRGDGRRYKLTLRLDERPGTVLYQAAFVATPHWQTLRFEPRDFTASFRGRAVAAPLVRFADMRFFGVLISDGQAGRFRLELQELSSQP
jgi:NADH dehydrogenase [ubiquinone] 1 alpha subcomplex assembly factor 1